MHGCRGPGASVLAFALVALVWVAAAGGAQEVGDAAAAASRAEQQRGDRELVVLVAYGTLFATVGVLSLAAAARWRAGRVPGLLLGAAMLLHSNNVLGSSERVRAALGGSPELWNWVVNIGSYLAPLPWTLLSEQILGRGWRSSVRRVWQLYAAYAILGILIDVVSARPGAALGPNQPLVLLFAIVALVNLFRGGPAATPDSGLLRLGFLAFMVGVTYDSLTSFGILPRLELSANWAGLAVFVGCLAYATVSRTLRGERQLQAIEQELATARRIQTSLLPSTAPRLEGATVAFRHVPAAAVAGDLFQFVAPGPRRVGILVADVCGHGVPAALIASMVKVAAAAQRSHADDPGRVLAGIHATLAAELPAGQFVTAVYVHVDLERGTLRHASAGHPAALVRSAGGVSAAGATGPLIVALASPEYPVSEIPLAGGDRVVLYTDGVVEARRDAGEMFGVERLCGLVLGSGGDAQGFVDGALQGVASFVGRPDGPFEDDLTLVALDVSRHRGEILGP